MRKLLPRSLAGQMIALLILALIAAQVASFLIFADERRLAIHAVAQEQVLSRTASLVRLLADTPAEFHARVVATASTPRLRFWLDADSAVDRGEPGAADNWLQRELAAQLRGQARAVLVDADDKGPWRFRRHVEPHDRVLRHHDPPGSDGAERSDERRRRGPPRPPPPAGLTLSVLTASGQWLNAATVLAPPAPGWAWASLVSLALTAVAASINVVLMVRRITRPMSRLALAADRLGRGEAIPPIREAGPEDVQQTIRAFNRMQARLERFVQDRTRVFAAISHDLRTPITSLRLRVELIEDAEVRDKVIETLDEMQRMTEASLAFAREAAAREDTRTVDLAALVDSLCEDLREMGLDVSMAAAARTPYACRPDSLKRALRNLIENAVKYGQRARVALSAEADELTIAIDDDGPGIPEADRERVFEPFVRLEESRSRDTGGIGLGMAIARSILRGHGGDITLDNRAEGGLRVAVHLPRADRQGAGLRPAGD